MALFIHNGKQLEVTTELIDITSLSRPDPSWKFIDPAGHLHRWHDAQGPLKDYHGQACHVPSAVRVRTPEEDYAEEDYGDIIETSRLDCKLCGHQDISPGTCADTTRVYMPGLRHLFIDGVEVSREEFNAAYRALTGKDLPA